LAATVFGAGITIDLFDLAGDRRLERLKNGPAIRVEDKWATSPGRLVFG